MKTYIKHVSLAIRLIAFLVLIPSCTKYTPPVLPTSTLILTNTRLPSHSPQPSQTPLPTITPTITPKPTPTIQLPKQVLTPLPFKPEPISISNAKQISELTRWSALNPKIWQTTSGGTGLDAVAGFPEGWSFQLAFSNHGTSLTLMPSYQSSTGILDLFNHDLYLSCTLGNDPEKGHLGAGLGFPGIPRLSIPEGKQLYPVSTDIFKPYNDSHGDYIYSPNGETLVIQTKDQCQLLLINLETGNTIKKINSLSGNHFGYVNDGGLFWTGPYPLGDLAGTIAFLNPGNGELSQSVKVDWAHLAVLSETEATKTITFVSKPQNSKEEIPIEGKVFTVLAVSPDQKTFISSIHLDVLVHEKDSNGNYVLTKLKGKQKVVLWNMSDGAMLSLLDEKDEWQNEASVAYSPDLTHLAVYTGGNPGIELLDIAIGKRIREFGNSEYTGMAYTPDGQLLIASTQDTLELLDVDTGNLLYTIVSGSNLDDWAYSPDGRYIGTITVDGLISLWGVQP